MHVIKYATASSIALVAIDPQKDRSIDEIIRFCTARDATQVGPNNLYNIQFPGREPTLYERDQIIRALEKAQNGV